MSVLDDDGSNTNLELGMGRRRQYVLTQTLRRLARQLTDAVQETSRVIVGIQVFAVGVELPKYYASRHWKSVAMLLGPVMTFGWLVTHPDKHSPRRCMLIGC
jgi:hypothetical protein